MNLRFPKCFKIFTLLDKNTNVTNEAIAKSIPTYFSEIILIKKVEFMYADRAICNVNRNERIYIRVIFFICNLIKYLIIQGLRVVSSLFFGIGT